MLYKRKEEAFDPELFQNPSSEYRGTPFWAWNCKLEKQVLLKEINDLKQMGMGGAHIHCRVGLDIPYLGDEFFDDLKACEEKMKKEGMLCWLYDEDRWPSGSAGGLVTKEEKYRSRFLVFEPVGYEEEVGEEFMSAAKAVRSENRIFLGTYQIQLDKSGYLLSYQKLDQRIVVKENHELELWNAWIEVSGDTPWFNNEAYVNTLDKKAIDRFIEVTHEKYYKRFGHAFGKNIPSIFTDEPQICHKDVLKDPYEKKAVILPFTDDFEETYKNKYGISLLKHLPELIWEIGGNKVSKVRYLYHRHLCERFSEAFGDNVGKWCEDHDIALTGHMMNEWTLYSQTMAIGEVMRPLKNFGLPGIDMLCDRRELSTAKQVQSIAHQMGREGVMSEIYGVTGWAFDFRNHKLAGDWQAALGVTIRVPHLSWVSMEGEAKRDYPASIGYQSPWYREYSYIENHFARLNTALTRGKPSVNVGVIHPIESYWLYWGNQQQTASIREMLESNFENLINWLLYGLVDFDFISESVLAEDDTVQNADEFFMGEMKYHTIIVPACRTLRSSTYEKLKMFLEAGGSVVFMGEIPCYLDGVESNLPKELAEKCNWIAYNSSCLLEYLERYRVVDITTKPMDGVDRTKMKHRETGIRTSNMFYQMRDEKDSKWLYVCHVNKPINEHIVMTEELKIIVTGEYRPTFYDTLTGEIEPIMADYNNGKTIITVYASAHDSFLFHLTPGRAADEQRFTYHSIEEQLYLPQAEHFTLEEENCYLLDIAEYAFDDAEWQPEEELLRIDNKFRKVLGYPLRMEALAQPWLKQEVRKEEHLLKLKYKIESDTEVEHTMLAMEKLSKSEIILNGVAVDKKDQGWYVDECIRKCSLPLLKKGINILEIRIPFGEKTNVEWCYLLGNFGVKVAGREKKIKRLPQRILYGNFVNQGLPFYAGNLIYETTISTEEGNLWIEVSHYRGALIQVQVDCGEKKNLIFAPYRVNCGKVSKGQHKIQIKIYGNRVNAMGAVHNSDSSEHWYGPNLWRTQGNKWSYEYQLEEMGVLTTPRYWVEK